MIYNLNKDIDSIRSFDVILKKQFNLFDYTFVINYIKENVICYYSKNFTLKKSSVI